MLNAVDNFQTVKGSYRTIIKPLNVDESLYFEIAEGKNPGSYVKVTDNKTNTVTEQRSDGQYILKQDKDKEYKKLKLSTNTGKPSGPRKTKSASGENVYINRVDPAISGPAQSVVLPQAYAFWLNDETNNYSIVGNETFLGRNATVIEGVHDQDMAIKHDATKFKLWVDSETGVLLKLIETNESGEVTNSVVAESIQFNIPLDSSEFSTQEPQG
jgi:hypothetical protein